MSVANRLDKFFKAFNHFVANRLLGILAFLWRCFHLNGLDVFKHLIDQPEEHLTNVFCYPQISK